jgi:hypothetical protein
VVDLAHRASAGVQLPGYSVSEVLRSIAAAGQGFVVYIGAVPGVLELVLGSNSEVGLFPSSVVDGRPKQPWVAPTPQCRFEAVPRAVVKAAP